MNFVNDQRLFEQYHNMGEDFKQCNIVQQSHMFVYDLCLSVSKKFYTRDRSFIHLLLPGHNPVTFLGSLRLSFWCRGA